MRRPPGPASWLALCAALGAGSVLVWILGLGQLLAWRAGLWQSQPWTLWTASLAHLSGAHLIANLLALGGLALLGFKLGVGPGASLAWFLAWPLGTLALAGWPQVGGYSGLSGVLHAGAGVLCAWCAMNSAAKPWGWVILAGLVVKLAGERAWLHPEVFSPEWGFNVVLAAHLDGALFGTAIGLLSGAVARAANFLDEGRGGIAVDK